MVRHRTPPTNGTAIRQLTFSHPAPTPTLEWPKIPVFWRFSTAERPRLAFPRAVFDSTLASGESGYNPLPGNVLSWRNRGLATCRVRVPICPNSVIIGAMMYQPVFATGAIRRSRRQSQPTVAHRIDRHGGGCGFAFRCRRRVSTGSQPTSIPITDVACGHDGF